jgi:hypothetical protein
VLSLGHCDQVIPERTKRDAGINGRRIEVDSDINEVAIVTEQICSSGLKESNESTRSGARYWSTSA